MNLGLSERKHLPVWRVGRRSFPLWKYKLAKLMGEMETNLLLDDYGRRTIDELPVIDKYYLPPFSLKGQTVLDLGACCGETAYFYLKHGAKKVICVEADKRRADILLKNKEKLRMNIEVINDFFKPAQLFLDFDFIKCDIEGSEVELHPYAAGLAPCILEAHGSDIKEKFERTGFKVIYAPICENNFCLMSNCENPSTIFHKELLQSYSLRRESFE